ncbi:VTT domain-containing protein [Patescibacteria group bacterium]|nr:VTT domain-containing protein [Patescibacteria group bacterium]MDE1946929.1 VTT domain-containing protein [Patescibacteria group bacterium]MDE2011130.1 VTT domain-containing protein [Patescibacteria group bacterium]MDE2233179.1 VTT domain-containing protein [Patescibacteria group bacterium]
MLSTLLNPQSIIIAAGTLGVIGIVFMETGLFFGFFFPGDSLLFTAGFLATQGYISFPWLLVGAFAAAVAGDSVGYAFGKKVGPAIFTKNDSLFFNRKHIARAQHFYEKHGRKTIILARFIPVVRTFAPIVAGVGNMPYKTFIVFNLIGGFLWTWAMLWFGYGLGALIPDPDRFVLPVVAAIIVISVLPALREIRKNYKIRA